MKVFILLIFSCIFYMNVESKKDVLQLATSFCSKKLLECDRSGKSNIDVSGIVVYFYDFENQYFESFRIDHAARGIYSYINNKNQKIKEKFYVYVGGFKSHVAKNSTVQIKEAFWHIRYSYLITVDHTAYTNDLDGYKTSYERSVQHVPSIGKQVAKMLHYLVKKGVSPKNIHCIGHSLGGQILGHVGKNFNELNNGKKISRITALDPAGPCFDDKNEHIRSGVAEYVEIYHCNAGVLGSDKSFGDVDFFANGGTYMSQCGAPSCALNLKKAWDAAKCSHKKCVALWVASMIQPKSFRAYKCDKKNLDRCKYSRNDVTTAGFGNPGTATGIYYFATDGFNLN